MKKFILAIILSMAITLSAFSQDIGVWRFYYSLAPKPSLPIMAIKTNVLYDAALTPNLGLEFALGTNTSLDVYGNYNGWDKTFGHKMKHWLVQPEFRYWLKERFKGHFFGINAHFAQYNYANVAFLNTKDRRHQGYLVGGGISYGYQWPIGRSWNMEASVALGYAHLRYDIYDCKNCGRFVGTQSRNYYGPTRAELSFAYLIK